MRDVCSSGYSWVRLNNDGDMTAGQRKRRNSEPLIRRSAMSSLPLSAQRTLHDAKTSFSSRGKTLVDTEDLQSSISKELLYNRWDSYRPTLCPFHSYIPFFCVLYFDSNCKCNIFTYLPQPSIGLNPNADIWKIIQIQILIHIVLHL